MNELISKLGIDWKLLLAQIVNFAVLFWLLKRFAFGPLGAFLKERSKKIAKGLEDADFASAEREKLRTLKAKMMSEAKKDVQTVMEEARARSDKEIADAWEKAKQKKEQLVGEAREEIQAEKERILEEARSEVGELVLRVSEKILGEKMDEDRDRVLVEKALKELK